MLISADRVVTPERVLAPGWLHLDGARITDVREGPPPRSADADLGAVTVAPGFVDIHCHGGGGGSFTVGDADEAAVAAAAHLRHGTTSLVASLVTDRTERMAGSVRTLADLVRDGLLAGIHLEGPWLSPTYAGAHDRAFLTEPDSASVDRMLSGADGTVKMVTLAPELPGAVEATRRLVQDGVVVAVGHTDASYDQTVASLQAGARVGTHLFNAMRGLRHREPGPIPALLEHDDGAVEVISDGVHVHPAMVRLAARAKPRRFVLVTDAMAAAAADDGDYRLGPLRVQVREGVARTPEGAIAGSTLTMAAAVRFAVASGVGVDAAIRAATETPASVLALDAGRLRAGAPADLVVLDAGLEVVKVMRAGRWIT